MKDNSAKDFAKKAWHFIWHSDSPWSWIANILIAFVLIKFIFYPVLGAVLGTPFPVVAVVSESMEHGLHNGEICGQDFDSFPKNFDSYWNVCGPWYENNDNLESPIAKEDFKKFKFKNGFNKGDIMVLWRANSNNLDVGDVLVFKGPGGQPIIHRVVKVSQEDNSYFYQTKGDHNSDTFGGFLGEDSISEDRIYGQAILRIPFLGWIKVGFANFLSLFGITVS
ncbi:signal peptidase I [archaeon]|jgi:signal peptidase I|nr:signal peptidase I [archaeon]MBT6698722.1 signal peptidase I [archaeon]